MSDYSQITFFTPKDSLATGNPNKIIYGSDVDAELSAISTAIATKADVDGDAIGAGTPATELSVDNLKLDANKIISTNTDGDIELEPNGAGYVVITNVDVNAGNIDNTVIGATTAAAITGTTLKANTSLELATGATVTAILDEDAMTSNSATALATQQSIKAYVDSQVTAQDLDVTTDSGTIAIDLDSETLTVAGGAGLDTSATGNTVTVAIDSTVATLTGAQTLTNKVLTSPDINTPDIDGGTIDGVTIGGSSAGAITGTTITGTSFVSSGDMTFGDNDKAIFGAGSDLQIYHNGSASYITDAGTGDLVIGADTFTYIANSAGTKTAATFNASGAVTLRYDNAAKLATTATGIDVTGTVTADGLTVDGGTTLNTSSTVFANLNYSNSNLGKLSTDGINVNLEANSNLFLKANSATRAKFDGNGDLSLYEDTGTTAKFFWDASAESLGIGTTNVSAISTQRAVEVKGTRYATFRAASNEGDNVIAFLQANDATPAGQAGTETNHPFMFVTNDTERMRIDSSGRVGIGTSSPARQLHVKAASGFGYARVEGASGGYGGLLELVSNSVGSGTDAAGVVNFYMTTGNHIGALRVQRQSGAANSGDMLFYTANAGSLTEKARIDSSGNLLVGTTSSTVANPGVILYPSGLQTIGHANGTASGTAFASFLYNNGAIGSITQNGTTGVLYNVSSDYRLKNVDGPITNSGAYIDALNPVQGSWKADGSRFIGFIAHEVQEVSETQIATGEKDGEEMQGMDYSAPELIANLIAEIQSLRARVAQLEGA